MKTVRVIIFYCYSIYYTFYVLIGTLLFVIRKRKLQWIYKKQRPTPPKILNDSKFGTHNYVQLEDIKIHYVEAGSKTKPLVLFVHGFPEFWYSWRHQLVAFSENYWCVAIDLRGYGDSGKPQKVSAYKMSYLVEDIRQIVTKLGREKFILVSHDWGGVIAWNFLHLHADMIDKYIIMDAPHPKLYGNVFMKNKKQRKMSWYVCFFQVPYLPELYMQMDDLNVFDKILPEKNSDDIEAYKYTFGKSGAFTPPINYYRNIVSNDKVKKRRPLSNPPPGLLIFGEKDAYLLANDIVKLSLELIPNLETKIISNAGHFVQQEVPDKVNDIMNNFLNVNNQETLVL